MFKLIKKLDNGVRIGELVTSHGKIETPFFMPVGTVGSVKGVSPSELRDMGAQIILSNTYHLYLRPGEKLIKKMGGLHNFIRWDRPILTDSGGYQVFSLSAKNLKEQETRDKKQKNSRDIENLVKICDEGVEFKSHLDGSKHMLTPEKVIQIQLDLGVDILMPLDVCPSGKATKEEVRKACEITIEWARRSKKYFERQVSGVRCRGNSTKLQTPNSKPLLHGIVQGGLYPDLRKWCADELIKLDFDGYSVGGLAVDNETRNMWKIVKLMGDILPENKQRYLMGVGTPNDILKAITLGMDMFDCVLPTRLARHGSVFRRINPKFEALNSKQIQNPKTIKFKLDNLLNSKFRNDPEMIDETCECYACKNGFSKAYISHLIRSKEMLGMRLLSIHNLYQYLKMLRKIRESANKS